ncbi:MAG: type II secretion system protein [Lactococcus sp.]|nr:type II secretion system protein [Lactococcus sp.]
MNKLALLVKDEEGMTLVELLAVIVILSIVAAIGGVAIAGVIQRSREDARVADVKMLYEAATLAEASDSYISKNTTAGSGATPAASVTAKMLNTEGYATSVGFLKASNGTTDTSDKVTFKLVAKSGSADKLTMSIPKEVTYAGSKPNKELLDKEAKHIKALTRETLF